MAVVEVTATRHWQILSSDSKPAGTNGSTVHVVDTGEQFISHNGIWEEDLRLVYAIKQANL